MYTHTHMNMYYTHTHMYVLYTHLCICITHTHIYVYVLHTHTHWCVCVYICLCMFIFLKGCLIRRPSGSRRNYGTCQNLLLEKLIISTYKFHGKGISSPPARLCRLLFFNTSTIYISPKQSRLSAASISRSHLQIIAYKEVLIRGNVLCEKIYGFAVSSREFDAYYTRTCFNNTSNCEVEH